MCIYIYIIYTYGCDFVRVQLHVDALSSFFHGPRCKILIVIDWETQGSPQLMVYHRKMVI